MKELREKEKIKITQVINPLPTYANIVENDRIYSSTSKTTKLIQKSKNLLKDNNENGEEKKSFL